MLFCRRETIEKTSMFVLVSALFFALAACSGAKEEPIPGTYEAVSLYDAPAYQLNENGSYDHGEKKGTYTTDSDRNIVLSPKDAEADITLTAHGSYYYTQDSLDEDTEYGLAPSFDENGRSGQTFTRTMDSSVEMTLSLHDDGTFQLSFSSQSPVFSRGNDVVSYEGSYTLEDDVLHLTWNDMDFPLLYLDEKIYPVVYTKSTEENSTVLQASRTAIQDAEEAARQSRWWTPVDDALSGEIISKLTGTWEYTESGQYGLYYRLSIDSSTVDVHIELLGYPAENSGPYTVCNDVILVHYTGGTKGYVAFPYTYENGTLRLYPINSLDDAATNDPGMQFISDEARTNGPWFTKTA